MCDQCVTVHAHGLTSSDLRSQLAIAIGAVITLFLILFATAGGPSSNTTLKIGLWLGVVLAGELVIEGSTSVRRIDIDHMGVDFRFLFHNERVGWSNLSPSGVPAQHQMWQVTRAARGRGGIRAYRVTVEMARAILEHPARPSNWQLSPDEEKSLASLPTR
jgi:hypothetical protein